MTTLMDQRKIAVSPCGADIYIIAVPNMELVQILRMGCERVASVNSIVLEQKNLSTVAFVAVDYNNQVRACGRRERTHVECALNFNVDARRSMLFSRSRSGKDPRQAKRRTGRSRCPSRSVFVVIALFSTPNAL